MYGHLPQETHEFMPDSKLKETRNTSKKLYTIIVIAISGFLVGFLASDFWHISLAWTIVPIAIYLVSLLHNKTLKLILGGGLSGFLIIVFISHEIHNTPSFIMNDVSFIIKTGDSTSVLEGHSSVLNKIYDYSNSEILYADKGVDFENINIIFSYQKFKENSIIPVYMREYSAANFVGSFSLFRYKQNAEILLDTDERFAKYAGVDNNNKQALDEIKNLDFSSIESTESSWTLGLLYFIIPLILYVVIKIVAKRMIFQKVNEENGTYTFNKPMWAEITYSSFYLFLLIGALWLWLSFDDEAYRSLIEDDESSPFAYAYLLVIFLFYPLYKFIRQISNINDEIVLSREYIKIKDYGNIVGEKIYPIKEISSITFSKEFFYVNDLSDSKHIYADMNIQGYRNQIETVIKSLYEDIEFKKEKTSSE